VTLMCYWRRCLRRELVHVVPLFVPSARASGPVRIQSQSPRRCSSRRGLQLTARARCANSSAQATADTRSRQAGVSVPPQNSDPKPLGAFLCSDDLSGESGEGPDRLYGPLTRRALMVGEGHAPVVAVPLATEGKPLAPMAVPKGHGPRHRRLFILQTGGFWGCRSGGHDGDHGPRQLGLVVSA
jgi:hypothetical protein